MHVNDYAFALLDYIHHNHEYSKTVLTRTLCNPEVCANM